MIYFYNTSDSIESEPNGACLMNADAQVMGMQRVSTSQKCAPHPGFHSDTATDGDAPRCCIVNDRIQAAVNVLANAAARAVHEFKAHHSVTLPISKHKASTGISQPALAGIRSNFFLLLLPLLSVTRLLETKYQGEFHLQYRKFIVACPNRKRNFAQELKVPVVCTPGLDYHSQALL